MKDLVWDTVLSVGSDEIDADHRHMVELFNLLKHSVEEGERRDYVEAVFEELINFTVWHFSHEERLMIKYGYPEYETHHAEHVSLIETVRRLLRGYRESGEFGEQKFEYLEKWMTGHILVPDMRFGAWLVENA